MPEIEPGRMTHRHEGELVVFLIGMTINKWWRPDLWLPTFLSMSKMLRELSQEPELGLLGFRVGFERWNPIVIQYWDSVDKLYAYAGNREAEHRPQWTKFNRSVAKSSGTVGIWHETFEVARAESIYGSTPLMGLAKATERIPVTAGRTHARDRISGARESRSWSR